MRQSNDRERAPARLHRFPIVKWHCSQRERCARTRAAARPDPEVLMSDFPGFLVDAPSPPRRFSLTRFLIDHNPLYLLSAACMLAGCLLLSGSTSYNPMRMRQLLLLILTLNVYEALLIALGLLLI